MPVISPSTIRDHVYIYLHARSQSDALIVNDSELDRVLSDALSDLAINYGIFVAQNETFITLVDAQADYDLPPRHISTLHAALDDRPLTPSSREETERRDASYRTRAATLASPTRRFYQDKGGFNRIGFHPVPSTAAGAGEHVEIIYHVYPCEVTDDVEAPLFVSDLLEVLATRDCYGKESDLAMPEVAKALRGLSEIYTGLLKGYWGMAQ